VTELVQRSVDFYGDELVVIHQDGIDCTPVKPICNLLGIDWEAQRRRIQGDEVLASVAQVITVQVNGDDRPYPMLCLPLDFLHGWLFGVNTNLIRPELRERLILYKRECYRMLARAFAGDGGAAAPLARVAALEARVDALEGLPQALGAAPRPERVKTLYRVRLGQLPKCPTRIRAVLVLDALRALGGAASLTELRAALPQLGYNALRGLLQRMVACGIVARPHNGRYQLQP
jgi:hypothetical protein